MATKVVTAEIDAEDQRVEREMDEAVVVVAVLDTVAQELVSQEETRG